MGKKSTVAQREIHQIKFVVKTPVHNRLATPKRVQEDYDIII